MKKYDVICPHCCGTFHETTIHYRPNVPVKGHMLTSKQHVKDAGWSTFPEYDSTEYADICCPSCNQQYLDASGLIVRMVESGEIEEPEVPKVKTVSEMMEEAMAEYEPDVPCGIHPRWNQADQDSSPKEDYPKEETKPVPPKKKPGRPKK